MTEWRTGRGVPVQMTVRQPDWSRGVGYIQNVIECSRCEGRGHVRFGPEMRAALQDRDATCSRCNGTGRRTRWQRVFQPEARQRFNARVARIRCHRQNRNAAEVLRRRENFETEYASVLAILRDNPEVPGFRGWLDEALRTRMLSDERVESIHGRLAEHEERLREQRAAEEEAEESAPIGEPGDRITVSGTVRYRSGFGADVGLVIVTDAGNWVRYHGQAECFSGLRAGDRVQFNARVRRHVNMVYIAPSGRRINGISASGTKVERPTRVVRL